MAFSRRSFAKALPFAGVSAMSLSELHAQGGVFNHGVASGDPLSDRVIIWTRVSPTSFFDNLPVEWVVAEDPAFSRIVRAGTTSTGAAFDYTVKVDVTRLNPGTTYYYRFTALGVTSVVGRTKTLPMGTLDRLRLAVCSCSNFPQGFFNSYRLIGQRADLDAVLHLGDYIYEYPEGGFGSGARLGRLPIPARETVTLEDYRLRLGQYRRDPDLQEAHRQHPWIVVWDDHESTNDAWRDGAQNHQPDTEGSWAVRRAASIQAWNEWMPVRETPFNGPGTIYRNFPFGNLADLVMLDTRLVGRDQQNRAQLADPNRQLLGVEQESWFLSQLSASAARSTRWRVIGQQVMMAQLVGPTGPFNVDQWDGYLAARNRFLSHLAANTINNNVVLTGDIHSSWATEISVNPFAAATAARQAVEFVGTSVTSNSGFEDPALAGPTEAQILGTHPHIRWVNLSRRGYMLVDINRDRAQAEWYFVRTITERRAEEDFGRAFATESGVSRLTQVTSPSSPKSAAPLA